MTSVFDALDRVQQATHAAFERHEVVLAYLYGSQARGDAGPQSDVDVAVRFADHVSAQERLGRVLRLSAELGELLQRSDVSVLDVAGAPRPLRQGVSRDGLLLHCSDPDQHARFAAAAVCAATDAGPLRRVPLRWAQGRRPR